MSQRVAVVTGSNRGIGRAIVQKLCEQFNGKVYLTSRDEEKGKATLAELKASGGRLPRLHQLDVVDQSSVQRFRDYLKKHYGGIDLFVNNAGVVNIFSYYDDYETAKNILDTNYRSLLTIEKEIFPLIRDGGRILNISSDCGHLSNLRNKYWIEKLSKKELTVTEINEFVSWHEDAVRTDTFKKEHFADEGTVAAYRVSKIAMSALTVLQQRMLLSRGIAVNSMHPGFVRTELTKGIGFYTPEQAAETPLRVLLDPNPQKGAYIWYDGRIVDWYDSTGDWYFKIKSADLYKQQDTNL